MVLLLVSTGTIIYKQASPEAKTINDRFIIMVPPGEGGKTVAKNYTIENTSLQKHYIYTARVEIDNPQEVLIGATWLDTGEPYILGEKFEVASNFHRELQITFSPNTDFTGELPIHIKIVPVSSVTGKG